MIGTPLSNVVRERPEHWKAIPAWAALRPVKEQGFPALRLLSVYRDHGVIEKDSRDDNHNRAGEDLSVYQRVLVGDVVMNKMKAWQGSIAVSSHEGIVSPDYQVLRPRSPQLSARFLHFLLRSAPYISEYARLAYGVRPDQWRLMYEEFRGIPLLVPSSDEQRAVVAFLDRTTTGIDTLIAKKERLIELLQEKRQAVITQAVTKGLGPNVPMKESRVPWFGRIPAHWEMHQLRRVVARFVDYRGRTPTKVDDGVPLITAGAVRDGRIDHARAPEYMLREEYADFMRRGHPELGDVVFTTEAPLGEVAQVVETSVAFAQRIILFKVNRKRMTSDFLCLYYCSDPGRSEVVSRASGSTAEGIRADRLRGSLVLVPPLNEQQAIVAHVRSELARVEPIRSVIQSQLDKLREYRQALITAAVTGKLDLSKEAA